MEIQDVRYYSSANTAPEKGSKLQVYTLKPFLRQVTELLGLRYEGFIRGVKPSCFVKPTPVVKLCVKCVSFGLWCWQLKGCECVKWVHITCTVDGCDSVFCTQVSDCIKGNVCWLLSNISCHLYIYIYIICQFKYWFFKIINKKINNTCFVWVMKDKITCITSKKVWLFWF